MPITLPQISRRKFLKRAALAGAATAVATYAQAGWFGKPRDQHTFFFFSDTHVAADPTAVKNGVNMADNLAACVRASAAWSIRPAAVIVNGDLAQRDGQPGDYATFAQIVLPLRTIAPVYLTLGNHDERENFRQALPRDGSVLKALPQKQATGLRSRYANWFLLDSLDVTDASNGSVGAAQWDWLESQLAASSGKPAIIVIHHGFKTESFNSGLDDGERLEKIFSEYPQVKAFVHGHQHDWHISRHSTGVQIIGLPPTAYIFKSGRPNGWVRCSLAADGAEFELRASDEKHPEHGRIQRLAWRH